MGNCIDRKLCDDLEPCSNFTTCEKTLKNISYNYDIESSSSSSSHKSIDDDILIEDLTHHELLEEIAEMFILEKYLEQSDFSYTNDIVTDMNFFLKRGLSKTPKCAYTKKHYLLHLSLYCLKTVHMQKRIDTRSNFSPFYIILYTLLTPADAKYAQHTIW